MNMVVVSFEIDFVSSEIDFVSISSYSSSSEYCFYRVLFNCNHHEGEILLSCDLLDFNPLVCCIHFYFPFCDVCCVASDIDCSLLYFSLHQSGLVSSF